MARVPNEETEVRRVCGVRECMRGKGNTDFLLQVKLRVVFLESGAAVDYK